MQETEARGPSETMLIKIRKGFKASRKRVALRGQPVLTPDSTRNKRSPVPIPHEYADELVYRWEMRLYTLLLRTIHCNTAKNPKWAIAGKALQMSYSVSAGHSAGEKSPGERIKSEH